MGFSHAAVYARFGGGASEFMMELRDDTCMQRATDMVHTPELHEADLVRTIAFVAAFSDVDCLHAMVHSKYVRRFDRPVDYPADCLVLQEESVAAYRWEQATSRHLVSLNLRHREPAIGREFSSVLRPRLPNAANCVFIRRPKASKMVSVTRLGYLHYSVASCSSSATEGSATRATAMINKYAKLCVLKQSARRSKRSGVVESVTPSLLLLPVTWQQRASAICSKRQKY